VLICAISVFFLVELKGIQNTKGFVFLPLFILWGLMLGCLEYFILGQKNFLQFPLNLILLGFVSLSLSGLTEEIIFRGIFQNLFLKVFNPFFSIFLLNILFAFMHLVWQNPFELVFVFLVGTMLSVIYYSTKNLILVSIIHAAINVSLFMISPWIFS
jgi:hypothetical protein